MPYGYCALRGLLSLKQYQNIPILSPKDAAGFIEANK